ncbi:MAG TPA: 5-(carboxyamino)imidazole ribonucleotide synthase, partial [Flavobacteriaceae bacterium]|nr:5-(carboxyamino)imidazole ribonucleotide synthase [Flavobacteriaceae bacterium]
MNYFSSDFKLGILGGGQLGKMLLTETQKFDIYTCVLEATKDAPCANICDEFHIGSLLDYDTVYKFGKQVNTLTFEIENVNVDALEQLEKEGIHVYPSSKTLRTIQNKAIQKKFYVKHEIPTAKFSHFATADE